MRKKKIVSKYKQYIKDNSVRVANPKYEFIEIPMAPEDLERAAHAHATWQQLVKDDPANDYDEVKVRMHQEENVKKIFSTASQILTEQQFKIFVMRYAYDLKQKDIAKQMKCDQSYIPRVLKASIKKIKQRLKAEGIL